MSAWLWASQACSHDRYSLHIICIAPLKGCIRALSPLLQDWYWGTCASM